MLEIIINNISLDLPENIALPVTLKNSFFSTGIVEGDLVYQSSVPLSDKNKKAIRFMHQLESTTPFASEFDCTIKFGGTEWASGKFIVTKISKGNINFRIAIGKSFFLKAINTLRIPDVSLPDVDFDADITERTHVEVPHIYNPVAYDGYSTWLNDYYGKFLNLSDSGWHSHCWAPQLYLKYVAQQVAKHAGLTLVSDLFDDAEIATLLIHNNTLQKLFSANDQGALLSSGSTLAITMQGASLGLVCTRAQLIITHGTTFEQSVLNFNGTLNVGTSIYGSIQWLDGFQKNDLNLSLNPAQAVISGFNNASYKVDLRLTIENPTGADIGYTSQLLVGVSLFSFGLDIITAGTLNDDFAFNPNLCLPDASAKDLISAIITTFASMLEVEWNELHITPKKTILDSGDYLDITAYAGRIEDVQGSVHKGYTFSYLHEHDSLKSTRLKALSDFDKVNLLAAVATLSALPVDAALSDVRFVTDERVYYIFTVLDDQSDPQHTTRGWVHFSDALIPYKVDDGLDSIQMLASTLLQKLVDSVDTAARVDTYTPEIEQPINAPYLNIFNNPNGLMFLFYRGENFASHDVYDADDNVIAAYSLRWDSAYGLYNIWWKRWIEFIKNAKVTENVPMYLPWTLINNYATKLFSQKLRIGENQFMMEELSFTLRKHTITDQKATLYTV